MQIGIIDSGITPSECSLSEVMKGFCHINDKGEISSKTFYDPTGHGTFNAALLAGKLNEGATSFSKTQLYVTAAIEGQVLVLKTLEALEWMLHQPIDILLMPFGIQGESPVFSAHIQALVDKGVLPIAAIGNEGASRFRAPGYYSNVLSVGACDLEDVIAPFSGSLNKKDSTTCIKPDVATLGVNIESTFKKIGKQSGTSMASTVLAGHAANLWKENPMLTNQQLAGLICKAIRPLQKGQTHRCKHGIFDQKSAKELAKADLTKQDDYLTPELYEHHIDPYLITKCKHYGEKEVHFILIPSDNSSLESISNQFKNIKIKKTYCNNQLALAYAEPTHVLQLMDVKEIKLLQAINVPFLSLN